MKNPPTYSYRRQGQAGSASRALIDTCRHPNPRLALEALLGPLASDPALVSSGLPEPGPDLPAPASAPSPESPSVFLKTPPAVPVLVYDVPWLHPEVPAHLEADGGIVLLACPHCGKQHRHRGFGHRLAHCDDPRGRGYLLCDARLALPGTVHGEEALLPGFGAYGAAAGANGATGPGP